MRADFFIGVSSKTTSLWSAATSFTSPMTELGTSERYLDYAVKVLQPILSAESAVVLGGSVVDTFKGTSTVGTSVNLNP